MMVFYEIAWLAVDSGLHADDAPQQMQSSCFILVALLSIAESHKVGILFKHHHYLQSALKPQLMSPRTAFLAAVDAILASTTTWKNTIVLSSVINMTAFKVFKSCFAQSQGGPLRK